MSHVNIARHLYGMHPLEMAFINTVGPRYLQHAQPPHSLKIRQWKPSSILPAINRLHSGVSGLKRRQARVLDHRLVWLEGGKVGGEAVVLLHGFASNKENWLSLAPLLLKDYRVYLLDLPGWGESEFNANLPYGLDQQVERVATWMKHHIGTPVHLVGNSLGGTVAALLAGRHSDLLRTVCLMNPAGAKGKDHTRFEMGLREGKNPMIVRSLLGSHELMSLAIHNRAIALGLAPLMARDLIHRRHVNRHMFHQIFVHAPSEQLPGMASNVSPTLVMWGKEDRLVHYTGAYTLQEIIPQAELALFDGVGHLPMVEVPIKTSRYLQDFWKRHAQPN